MKRTVGLANAALLVGLVGLVAFSQGCNLDDGTTPSKMNVADAAVLLDVPPPSPDLTPGPDAYPFMAVAPCNAEGSYMKGTAITQNNRMFMPACLKVNPGGTVKFTINFSVHPLWPSKTRGDQVGNPITHNNQGTEASFTFNRAGFYAFYCENHGGPDGGMVPDGGSEDPNGMAGVIWVSF